jgi:hypothetical protein
MAKLAVVQCAVPNGLRLTLERREEAGLTGVRHVNLEPGENRINADFWTAWISENANYAPVVAGSVSGEFIEIQDDDEPDEPYGVDLPAAANVMGADSNMHFEADERVAVQPAPEEK